MSLYTRESRPPFENLLRRARLSELVEAPASNSAARSASGSVELARPAHSVAARRAALSSDTCVVRTPFGTIELTASGDRLTAVRWTRRAPGPGPGTQVLRQAVRELEEFAQGRRVRFDVPLDLGGVRGFRREVLDTLVRRVPFGRTVTYGELAALAGRPRAARAVGSAMSSNPLPIFVPCHRVVGVAGLGGFGPGLATKRALLRHESEGAEARA